MAVQSQDHALGSRGVGEGAEAEEPAVSKGGNVSGCSDLEEFNVKTLYDKLEDQNLHIASQLARHRKDIQEFYRNICQHTESLKDVIENIDSKKLSLLKEILAHNVKKDKVSDSSMGGGDPQAAVYVSLLEAVLRSVEALLCRLIGESWQSLDLPSVRYYHTGLHDARDCETQAGYMQPSDTNMCFTQFSSVTMTKPEETDHIQSTAPCISDHELSKLVSMSPLYKTLHQIQQSLQNFAVDEPHQDLHNAVVNSVLGDNDGLLIPTALDSLSPQHSSIFLFGCQVMQLLANYPMFPSVLLLLAKSFPSSSPPSNESLLAHCSADFYFDATNQILYLSEAKLQHVGHFIADILQSMALIAAGSKPQMFMLALHEAMSALSLQLFNLSFKWNSAEADEHTSHRQDGTLVEQFLNIRVPSEAGFTNHLLASRLEKYKYFKLEQLISNLKQNSAPDIETGLPPKGTPVKISCIEEEIDRMSESFLKLSMQLQRRAQMSTESSAGNHERETTMDMPSLSRNGTSLLEMRRCYVSQRLNELQVTLGQMRRCQQHDSKWKDGTGGGTQSDVKTTQQAQTEHYAGVNGFSPHESQQQYSSSANQSSSQFHAERRDLSKLECPVSDQQGRSDVHSNNPNTLLDCRRQSQEWPQSNIPGKIKLNNQTTIENTTKHSGIDDIHVPTNQNVDLNVDK